MQNTNRSKRTIIVLAVALLLILVGDLLAFLTQTECGKVTVRDVRFTGADGKVNSALLYVPKGVTPQNKAPGILAIHGYINSRETQDGFAIEFARRGYVVLAVDMPGHGYSEPPFPSATNPCGGPDGLRYLRSLDFVDTNNIGLEGHSMGGWGCAAAANALKDGYKSIVMEGSGTGLQSPAGTATFPHNMAVVLSQWDEFSALMWAAPVAKDVVKSAKLKRAFGTTDDVVVGKLYGSIADGTARELYMPRTTHPGDHISPAAIGDAVEWFQATLQGGNGLPPSNQIWYLKEIGNLIALIGMILLLFPVGSLLLRKVGFFKTLEEAPAKPKSAKGIAWWIGAAILVIVPPLTYFSFVGLAPKFIKTNLIFSQDITTQLLFWILLNGLIALVLFLLWHFVFNRKAKATASDYGLSWVTGLDWKKIGKSFLLAVLVAFIGYLTLALSAWLFTVDYRFWVFAVKPMSLLHFRIFLCYLIPFILYFMVLGTVLHGQLRVTGGKGAEVSRGREMGINVVLLVVGFVGLLLYQYIPLLMGGTVANPNQLLGIVAIQLLPIMTIVALVSTYFYRKTGHVYVGAFLIAILVTWIVVASQAIQFAF